VLVEQQIEVNGETLLLDRSGALWWPSERTLVCSDMHFEKGSSYARSGQFLPPYDTRTTLKRVMSLMDAYQPARVISLGDAFHDRRADERLDDGERAMLMAMGDCAEWVWITGNHDPVPPAWLSGAVAEEVAIGALVFRHEPSEISVRGEIAGHLHPCKTVSRRGQSLRRRCFVSDGSRMVMPAFGAYAGGLDVRDDAVRTLFVARFLAYVLGRSRVFAVAA
jgi:DNA ligase-associated metallophosphoesterase